MFDLTGQNALVTGSTRGIGRAIAMALGKQGAAIAINGRDQERCDQAAAELRQSGITTIAAPGNCGEKDDIARLVAHSRAELGAIDILVANAATNPYFGSFVDLPDEAFERILTTNLRGPAWLCQQVLPMMAERGKGCVILISSIGAFYGHPKLGAYGVSKAALNQLTRTLCSEWGPSGVRINAIAPGLVRTEFARALWEDPARRAEVENRTPLRRIGEPDDIGPVAAFLASSAASYITGQVLVVDGGALSGNRFGD